MPAYVIAAVQIGPEAEDHANYARYADLGGAAVAKFGAELLAMEDAPTLIEGNLPASRILLLRFNDVAHAQQWYDSPEYQQAIPYRRQAAETRFILAVNGLAPGQ